MCIRDRIKTSISESYRRHYKTDGEVYLVCKKFFIGSFKVGDKMIRNIIKKTTDGIVKDEIGKHNNQTTLESTLNI